MGQSLVWEIVDQANLYIGVAEHFGDFDHDGVNDVLTACYVDWYGPAPIRSMRILSGATGAVLADQPVFDLWRFDGVGDFDQDGFPDLITSYNSCYCYDVWSPQGGRLLLRVFTFPDVYDVLAGGFDTDADGLGDLLVGTTRNSFVAVLDNSGVERYRLTLAPFGFTLLDADTLGDVDGDGCDDFVVGAVHNASGAKGHVALVSGRTGTILHVSEGRYVAEALGKPVFAAGDMDMDGVPDYGAGTYWGRNGLSSVRVFSGRTGAEIRSWESPNTFVGDVIAGGADVDLDGVPDVVHGTQQIRALSGRDLQELSQVPASTYPNWPFFVDFAEYIASLGPLPGSPYPAFAVNDNSNEPRPRNRIQVWRLDPPGSAVQGTSCGPFAGPTIGLRPVDRGGFEHSRIVLGNGLPGAAAFCCIGTAAATSANGVAVPLLLDPFGLQGCALAVAPQLAAFRVAGSAGIDRGYAALDLLPPLVATGSQRLAAQWLLLDPATLAYAVTARHEFTLR